MIFISIGGKNLYQNIVTAKILFTQPLEKYEKEIGNTSTPDFDENRINMDVKYFKISRR